MTEDRRVEDEFKKLLRASIDGRETDGARANASWGEQEDVYTPSQPRPTESELQQEQRRERSDWDQEWNQNVGSAIYAIKRKHLAEGEDTADDPSSSSDDAEKQQADSDTEVRPVAPTQEDRQQPTPSQLGRTTNWGLRIVSAVAVMAIATWFVVRDQQVLTRLRAVEHRLDSLQQQAADGGNDAADRERTEYRLADVEAEMAELSLKVSSPRPPEGAEFSAEAVIQWQVSEQKLQLESLVGQVAALAGEVSSLRKTLGEGSKPVSASGVSTPNVKKVAGGRWVINLITVSRANYAARLSAKYRAKGVETEQLEFSRGGKRLYSLRISGFPTKAAAEDYADEVRPKLGLQETWVTPR